MRHRIALFIAASITFALPVQIASAASDRVALVIGNGAYINANKLTNPPNDAADIASALRKLGFDVVEGRDLDKRAMESKVIEFSRKLDQAGTALFFYAGHGMQVGGRNYLIPIDAKLERGGDLSFETLDVSQVLAQMEAEKRVNLVFLDACRDNPLARSFSRSLGTRSAAVGQGLASIQSAVGTMIVYATQPDNVALDGDGTRNSPFTAALLKHIATPGLEVRSMMTRVRSDVLVATRDKQVPWDHSSLTSDVFLTPALAASTTSAPTASTDSGEIAWGFLKDTNDAGQLRRFAEQYPESSHRNEAVARLFKLEQTKVATLPPADSTSTPTTPQSTPPVRTSEIDHRTFDIISNQAYAGRKLSVEECRDTCIKDKKCNAWSYFSDKFHDPDLKKNCFTYENAKFGKNQIPEYFNGIVVTGSVAAPSVQSSVAPEPVRTSAIVKDRGISSNPSDHYWSAELPNIAACRDGCLADKKCNAWQYRLDKFVSPATPENLWKLCGFYAKGEIEERPTPGMASGVVKSEKPISASTAPAPEQNLVRTSAIVNGRGIDPSGKELTSKKLDSAAACRDLCLANKKCNAWEYRLASFESFDPQSTEMLRRACWNYDNGVIANYSSANTSSGVVKTETPAATSSR